MDLKDSCFLYHVQPCELGEELPLASHELGFLHK